jgi:hypothetical protein
MPKLTPNGKLRITFDFEVLPDSFEYLIYQRYLSFSRTERHQILAKALLIYFSVTPVVIKKIEHEELVDLMFDLQKRLHWVQAYEKTFHLGSGWPNLPVPQGAQLEADGNSTEEESDEILEARQSQLDALENMF